MYYNRFIMERFKDPVNAGGMHGANAVGEVVKDHCNDMTRLYLKINDNNIIESARFKTFGCCAGTLCRTGFLYASSAAQLRHACF